MRDFVCNERTIVLRCAYGGGCDALGKLLLLTSLCLRRLTIHLVGTHDGSPIV